MKNFSKQTFIIGTLLAGLLLIPSFFAAWAADDGTLENNIILTTLAQLFSILRFPTHSLFWKTFSNNGTTIYFLGLGLNCLFYGFTIERLKHFLKQIAI